MLIEDRTERHNAAGFGDGRREPGDKECRGFQKMEKARKWTVPSSLEKDCSPAGTSIFTQRGLGLTPVSYSICVVLSLSVSGDLLQSVEN